MDCNFHYIEPLTDGGHRLNCPDCGRDAIATVADPRNRHRVCSAKPRDSFRVVEPVQGYGPGTELTKIFAALGATLLPGCDCISLSRDMDRWAEACSDHREEILSRLQKNYKQFTLTDKMKAAILAWPAGVATKIKWTDPLPGLLDLAIQRATLVAQVASQ